MICDFMDSEKQLTGKTGETSRPADVYDLWAWFEVNKLKVAVIAVVAIVVGFSVATYRYIVQQKELKASDALLALKPALIPPTNAAPLEATSFFKVADEYKGTDAAERAEFYGATVLFSQNKYAEAEAAFGKFLKEYEGTPWAAASTYGIAAAQEAQGKGEALASYQNVFARFPQSAEADLAKMAVARIYEAKNQPDQALRIYNELTLTKPGAAGPMANPEILQKKEALLRKYPNLNTNNVAPVVSSPVTIQQGTNATFSLPSTNGAAAPKTATNAASAPATVPAK
jgi:tetratricopeptide (TPR) repeat protein